ncbi:hypothetical protein [Nonomuraea zeae]|uniref:Uncharacterized protein n=1 Tax=Nonomuraea zeae TaxID=1642303 RepID=A0A5S4FRP2_9ACTN|nr:hypothetical protein [Nonomuraea zeae]TMR23044.1 hypothetical protein ETD85_48535 [Nonomuraea zeae]
MRARKLIAAVAAVSSILWAPIPAAAQPTPPPPDKTLAVAPEPSSAPESVDAGERAEVLGSGWEKSSDRAVATAGDAAGFHVLVADAKDGYRWRTAASLSEPGFDTDSWIGNICVTASGARAVVVYAPRTFTNKSELNERGGFTAIVDLNGGAVRKLPVQTTLAYFNPGCGPSESAVLTQDGVEDQGATRLFRLDTAGGKLERPIQIPGQLTSAVPAADGIVAADSGAVVRVHPDGKRTVVAPAKGVPYRLAADADGGVVYAQLDDAQTASVRRVDLKSGNAVTTLATGAVTDLSVRSARGGRVFVTGAKATKAASPAGSVALADVPHQAGMSLSGEVAVTSVRRSHVKDATVAPADPGDPLRVDITATSLDTKKAFTLSVTPAAGAGDGARPSPALGRISVAAGNPNDPSDGDQRYCSVARNDPRNQAMQPKPRQVEWAADQAVVGQLSVARPANWKNLGMPAYSPQGLFPLRALDGGGYIPAQILMGVAVQESNTWQAARFAVPGVTANPLIGNYFGIDYYNDDEGDDWSINWAEADCGYGIMQITDGMRLAGKEKPGETALPYNHQRAIALDFAANIARGQQMLADKWNETRRAGLVVNNGTAAGLENWFFAVWAYNSGLHQPSGQNPWGLGWLNNPVNPRYPADRPPFMETSYADSAHPQDWPYPEKVLGFAGHPIELIESPGTLVYSHLYAWWNSNQDRYNAKPPVAQFCQAANDCYPGESHLPNDPEVIGEPAGPCAHKNSSGLYDLKCWWHQASTWKAQCPTTCGNGRLRFDPGYAYQEDATSYAPNCGLTGLPSGALIIDNLPTSVPSVRPNCSPGHANAGSFQFDFLADISGNYPGKIDVHQIGTGFAGQFWMSNTLPSSAGRRARGTWTLNQSAGWARLFVHLPVSGARTQQAAYEIDVNGSRLYGKKRYLPQQIGANGWVSLGVYNFNGTVPSVRLSNVTKDGKGTVRIAWDAIAVQKLPGKPKHIVAALGDSYSSGEGAGSYFPVSDADHGTAYWNACRRSRDSYSRKVVLPGDTESLGALSDRFDANHELGFVACSGAKSLNAAGWQDPASWSSPSVYEKGEGQFHEIAQLESGVLDENTTLVTLTLGGNDQLGGDEDGTFSKVINTCIIPGTLPDCAVTIEVQKARAGEMADNVTNVIKAIRAKASNATIMLLGYPEPISTVHECASMSNLISLEEARSVAGLVQELSRRQQALTETLRATGIPVFFARPDMEFYQSVICDNPSYINALVTGPKGEGDFHQGDEPSPLCIWENHVCISRESFHPKSDGTSAYARVLRTTLDNIGYARP